MDMNVPAFAENGNGRSLGGKQRLQVGILFRRVFKMPGRAECSQLCMFELDILHGFKILNRHRVGAGPSAFNKIYAKFV